MMLKKLFWVALVPMLIAYGAWASSVVFYTAMVTGCIFWTAVTLCIIGSVLNAKVQA